MREVDRVCNEASRSSGVNARFLDSWVRERVGIKRAITGGGVPAALVSDFENLWTKCMDFIS